MQSSPNTGADKESKKNIAESNCIDAWVKESLWHEMTYRYITWSLITFLSYVIIYHITGFKDFEYFLGYSKSTLAILNLAAPINIFIMLTAITFKDMEARKVRAFMQDHPLGRLGTLFRKVNCEVLLWVSGLSIGFMFILIFSTVSIVINSPEVIPSDLLKVIGFCLFFLFISGLYAWLYVMCRRDRETIFSLLIKDSLFIPIIYLLIALIAIGYIYVGF